MKKIIISAVIFSLCVLQVGCAAKKQNTDNSIISQTTITDEISVAENAENIENVESNEKTLECQAEILQPENTFEYTEAKNPEKQVTVKITADLENVDKIRIYYCKADSSDKQNYISQQVGEYETDRLPENKTFTVKVDPKGEFIKTPKDNSKVKVNFSSMGYKISAEKDNRQVWYEYIPCKVTIDTGTIYQYKADFQGVTACGASNGVLVIQPASPLKGKALLNRFNKVRNFSKISTKYSGGKKLEYCMAGDQVVNSVNDYLTKNGITEFSVKNFDDIDIESDELARKLVDTGRPAMFDIQYQHGKIKTKSPYSHWITVNGYKISADGKSYKLRWENTIEPVNSQWVDSSLLNKAVQGTVDNRDFSYYKLTEKQVVKLCGPIKRNIVALKEPLVESFVE